ncbi:MAG TPA: hypothetical protein VJN01_14505 [Xanthomonadales bacterium]|nr:hypothetical protein [Xanthomonadales bacterium]
MKRWRKYIVCLLLVTVPVSLWAAVAAPLDCDSAPAATPTAAQVQPSANPHAHHAKVTPAAELQDKEGSGSIHHNSNPGSAEPCCDTCISACLASSLTAMNLSVAALQSAAPETHFNQVKAARFLPGPSYPSLYRPPISQI